MTEEISKRISSVENILRANSNDKIAREQRAYMKNRFEYFGLKTPERMELLKDYLKFKRDKDELLSEVEILWGKTQRDFQYVAMKLLERNKKILDKSDIDFVENLIIDKSWWDSVDLLASNIMGFIIKDDWSLQRRLSKKWIASGNMWLQRTSLIFQLKYKGETNLELLEENIKKLNGGKEFFINKAIGWALRQYVRSDERWVVNFVNSIELSPLSRREALKNITSS